MKLLFDTYDEFKEFAMGGSCPSSIGFNDTNEDELCAGFATCDCLKCWMKCGADIVIKENPTKKITLQFDLPMCPYWDPITKTARHTCGGCHCEEDGNTVGHATYGIMAEGDRYCCLNDDIDIRAGIVEAVKEDV